MPCDATKRDADLEAELPWSANVELLLFGGFFGRILDLRRETYGIPWAYVIAMPALQLLGEGGVLYAAGALRVRNDTLQIGPEPELLAEGEDWGSREPDMVLVRDEERDQGGNYVHTNGLKLLRKRAAGDPNPTWEVIEPRSDFVKTLTVDHFEKVLRYNILPQSMLAKVPVTNIVPALRTAIAASNSQKVVPREHWRTLVPDGFRKAQMLCRNWHSRYIHQRAIVLNQQLLEADVDMLLAASILIDLRLEAVSRVARHDDLRAGSQK